MELKEGMYVRDAYEGIGQVTSICKCSECYERGFYEPQIKYANSTEYVRNYIEMQKYEGRASNNIIDLIEENDYIRIITSSYFEPVYYSYGKLVIRDDIPIEDYSNDFIAEVITHEQMKSISYRIGG